MKKKTTILVFLLIWLFSACTSANQTQAPTATNSVMTSTPKQQATKVLASETPLPLSTPTNYANLPSISPETRKAVLTSFVQANGDCHLPCILGLTPAISDRSSVKSFTSYFQKNSFTSTDETDSVNIDTFSHENWSGANLSFFENKTNVQISLSAMVTGGKEKSVERLVLIGQAMQVIEGGLKKLYGNPYYAEILAPYSLPNILETYGHPDQVIIRPFPDEEGYPSPPAQYTFDFVLFYPKRGFVVNYVSVRAEKGGNFVGCPTEPYLTQVSSWSPNKTMSIAEAIRHFSNLDGILAANISEYKQLEDVTTLSLTDFYNVFRVPDSSNCVQTPKKFWTSANQ